MYTQSIHVKLIPSDENKMIITGENIETVVFTLKKDVLKIVIVLINFLIQATPTLSYIH